MKNISRGVLLGLAAFLSVALAATFNHFTPATGILVGSASSSTTTAATSANVIALWSGTCNASSTLRGDGSCVAAGTAVTDVAGTAMTLTCTGFAACPAALTAGTYTITGHTVCINIAAGNGTSNATSFTFQLPTVGSGGLFPANQQVGSTFALDNGANIQSMFFINSTGGVIVYKDLTGASSTTWTAAGTKGLSRPINLCYSQA